MTEEELCRECANDDFWRGYQEGRGEAAADYDMARADIAELEADCAILRAANFGQSQTIDGYAARIAILEAALKPFADKADKAERPFEPPYPEDYPLWRAARAAYLGEKE